MNTKDKKIVSIADLLKSHPEGLTITDIMRGTGLARHTVLTRLFFLMGKGDVAMRRVNMAKLHTWVGGGGSRDASSGEPEKKEDVKLVSLKEEHIKPIPAVEKVVELTEKTEAPVVSKDVVGGDDPKLSEQEKEIERLKKELEEMRKSFSENISKNESPIALKIREAAARFEAKAKEVKSNEAKAKDVPLAPVPTSSPATSTATSPAPVAPAQAPVASASAPVQTSTAVPAQPKPKEKLDMIKIKKYIRGEIPLSALEAPKVIPPRPKGVPSTVIKKVPPVATNFDKSKVRQVISKDVSAGKINKTQAQVLTQRAPVSHVVENVAHPKEAVPLAKKDELLKTGVPGFDELFEKGGLPRGAAVLVAGGAGSGKTLLCLQTMINRANNGEKCLFMSFEESEERLVEHMEMFGWNPRELIASGNLLIRRFNPYEITRSVDALLMKAKGELLIEVDPIVFPENFKPDLIVVDSLTAIASAFTAKEDSYRIYIEQLFRFFEELGSTAFLITETEQIPTVYSTTGVEEFLADGVVVIYNFKRGNTRENALEVLKMRGVKHQKKIVAMRINNNGITVYPDQEVYGGIQDQ